MAKNFFKNIFNQTKNSLMKKKTINDSQKLSDIIIINNNESNFYQQKPLDKFNVLSYYYPKKEKKNKKDNNFLDRINELNNKFYLSQEKYNLVKSSLEKINDDLFSNLLKQIDCYIEEIERLNKRLAIINNDNKEEVIQKLNKKILENEKAIRNYEHRIKENANKEDKLTKEIEYYKKRIIFYKNKININLISRKISSENDGDEEKNEKNNNTNLKIYNNISNSIKPRYTHVRSNYFNQSSGRIIKIKHDKKLLSSTEFPSFSSNKGNNIRNKINSKRKTFYENENIVSEFLADKESKDDSNINNRKINTVIETLDFSNDSADSINEKNDSEDFDTCENLNINENMKKLYSHKINKNKENYIKSKLNRSEILNNKINIKEEKNNEFNSKDNSINQKKSENLNIKSNLSINIKNNNALNKSFFKQKSTLNNSTNNNTTKNTKDKVINRFNTFNNSNNNQKIDKSANENSNKTTKNKNEKNKIIENKKEKDKQNYKHIEKLKSKNENNINEEEKKINAKKKMSKSTKKIPKLNKKDEKKVETEEKDLKKVLKDINEDYDNELEMLNNQENQIKFLLNLIDVNN